MSYSNESTTSSPDPLGMSHNNNLQLSSPLKQREEIPKLTPKKVLRETSNNVRLHDVYLTTSPAAKNHFATPNKEGVAQPPISPWRIRVIVQAEPENENETIANAKHSIQPSVGRTITTLVPLKEAGESIVDAHRRSGATPQKKLIGKRPGTPKPSGAAQHNSTSMSSLKNKNDAIPQVATTPKRSRGRPRKSQGGLSGFSGRKPENRNTATHVSPLDNLGELGLLGEMTGPRRRGRRKASTPRKQFTRPKVVVQGSAQDLQLDLKINEEGANSQQVNGLKRKMGTASTPVKNQRVKRSRVVTSSPNRDSTKKFVPTSGLAQEHSTNRWPGNRENIYTQGNAPASESSPTLDAQYNSEFGNQAVASVNVEEIRESQPTGILQFSDPTSEHHEFDSILESEGFSMISVSTLPSGKVGLNIDRNGHQGGEGDPDLENSLGNDNPKPTLSPAWQRSSEAAAESQLQVSFQDKEKFLSVSAVKNVERLHGHQTPSSEPLEPSNLPLLQPLGNQNAPRVLDEVTDSTPKIIRVVRAGTALQGVMGPQELAEASRKRANQESDASKSYGTVPESDCNNLFDGFGAGTQRELRAGLRLGEELAKSLPGRTNQMSPKNPLLERSTSTHTTTLDSLGSSRPKGNLEDDLTVPNAGHNISYPVISNCQLPSPDRSEIDADEDQMSLDTDMSAQIEESMGEEHDSQSDGDIDGVSYNSHNRTMEREAEWQREREAVVRQIEMANSSRVIIIDGDTELQEEHRSQAEEKETMENSDICQAEAHSSDTDLSYSEHQLHGIIQSQVFRPRRSQIPSPWRRQERLGPAVQGDSGSDLFWQPGRAANVDIRINEERSSSCNASNPSHAAKPRELLESSHRDQLDKDSESIIGPNQSPFRESDTSPIDESLDGDLNGGRGETQSPVAVLDSIERDELTTGHPNGIVDSPRTYSSKVSIRQFKATKISRANRRSRSRTRSKSTASVASSTSWLSYIVSYVPGWNQPAPPKPLPRLPNGRRRLPVAVSEGPLCLYLPWTLDHWKALYVHYAAAREGRATFRFNRFGPTAWHVGVSHRYRHWQKPITQEDSAIADAFLSDLRCRGVSTPPHNGVLIDDYKVLGMLFYLWKAGVMNGECEVGVGKTGWQTGTQEWWRPDMESWYQG